MSVEMDSKWRPQLQGRTIAIAVAAPLSGRPAVLGTEMKQGIELAVEEANEQAGIFGAEIELRVFDDAADIATGEAVARRLCQAPDILGVVGHYNSDVTLAASVIYEEHRLTMITPIVSNPALTEMKMSNIFRFTNRDDQTAFAMARYLYTQKAKQRAIIFGTTTKYGRSMSTQFKNAFEAQGGRVLEQMWVEEGTINFDELVYRLPSENDVFFYGGTFEGAPLLKALRTVGRQELFATGDGCWDVTNFLDPSGDFATLGEGILVLSAAPEIGQVSGSQEFSERYAKRYGKIGNYAVNSYDTTRVLLAAIKTAAREANGVPSREAIAPALRSSNFSGISYRDPVHWDAFGDNVSAVTALHVAGQFGFRQIAEYSKTELR